MPGKQAKVLSKGDLQDLLVYAYPQSYPQPSDCPTIRQSRHLLSVSFECTEVMFFMLRVDQGTEFARLPLFCRVKVLLVIQDQLVRFVPQGIAVRVLLRRLPS